MIILLKIYF